MRAKPFYADTLAGPLCLFVVAATALMIACAPSADPFVIGERKELRNMTLTPSTPSGAPSSTLKEQTSSVSGGAAATQQQDEQTGTQTGPPSEVEFIKFASWDENRVKLTSFIAGYITAHGLDHPVRIVDLNSEDVQDALVKNDVDVVLEAPTKWAENQAESGNVIVLGTLSSENPDSKITVHVSMRERAPDVIEFLKRYSLDGEVVRDQAARIRGGRVGLKENVVGLSFLKSFEEIWTPWVTPNAAELVRTAVMSGEVGLCRKWAVSLADPFKVKYCTDDPTLVAGW